MIGEEFKKAVEKKDLTQIKVTLKNSLLIDESFKSFDELENYAKKNGILFGENTFYEKHIGEIENNRSSWNKEFLNKETSKLIKNYSKERIKFLKELITYLEKDKKTKESSNELSKTTESRKGFSQQNSNREKFEKNKKENLSRATIGKGVLGVGGLFFTTGLIKSLIFLLKESELKESTPLSKETISLLKESTSLLKGTMPFFVVGIALIGAGLILIFVKE